MSLSYKIRRRWIGVLIEMSFSSKNPAGARLYQHSSADVIYLLSDGASGSEAGDEPAPTKLTAEWKLRNQVMPTDFIS